MKDPFKRGTLSKFGWSMEDVCNKPTTRRMWKRTWKQAGRRAAKKEANHG